MKKIDLHLHTKKSLSDYDFTFSMAKLKEYVEKLSIDCIAITNHNLFDLQQYLEITATLNTKVFPGIEIDLERGHLLLISEATDLDEFASKCSRVEQLIINKDDFISVEQLKDIFGDLKKYLLIPHYDKSPIIRPEIILQLSEFITAGEVTSAKKFNYCLRNPQNLVPVLFSDLRFFDEMETFSPRQTFIDIDDDSLRTLKLCLTDKQKVFLSEKDGHRFFQAFEDGQLLSSGLNVILGERSSGKSWTLNKIFASNENVKYIKQFELQESDEERDKERFNKFLSARQSNISENYLKEFKSVVDDVVKIDRKSNEKNMETYIDSLLKVAAEEEKKDVYSQAALFNENRYTESDNANLKKLISSVEIMIENIEYREIIDRHLAISNLKNLIADLIQKYIELQTLNNKKLWINSLVTNIKRELQSNTASTGVEEIDFYAIQMDTVKFKKFNSLVYALKIERVIEQSDIRKFKIVATTKKYNGAGELLKKASRKMVFSDAYARYSNPIIYLEGLKEIQYLDITEYYKYFIDIEFKILNRYGAEVSGGERSEFNLLDKIQNAHHFDLLLIDEPESSFDNLFLKNEVNEQIREIAKSVPIVIVTHNSTVGASIKPDFILYTKKEIVDRKASYELYSGVPSDLALKTVDGKEIKNYDILLDCLEAGGEAYIERNKTYAILKN
jgi:ABC-type dipeptide/oligopeptide/nickel transport system ATPase component